ALAAPIAAPPRPRARSGWLPAKNALAVGGELPPALHRTRAGAFLAEVPRQLVSPPKLGAGALRPPPPASFHGLSWDDHKLCSQQKYYEDCVECCREKMPEHKAKCMMKFCTPLLGQPKPEDLQ
ncbi:unnamed protein product, partial [Symbiodinium sp. KB8]